MVDTHCHALPGIDDGAKDLEEALALCRIAAADGIRTLVMTPHVMEFRYPNDRATIEGAFRTLSGAVEEERIPVSLVRGAEVHAAADLVVRLKEGDLLTYADGGRYLLLEFPFQEVVNGTEEIVYRLRLAGVTPVIAHPERIGFFMEDLDRLRLLTRLGAFGQVTGGSLLGQFGEKSERAAWKMVDQGLVQIVASDAHDPKHRPPVLSAAVVALSRQIGEDAARRMSDEIPSAILAGQQIEVQQPAAREKGLRGLFSRFFSRR